MHIVEILERRGLYKPTLEESHKLSNGRRRFVSTQGTDNTLFLIDVDDNFWITYIAAIKPSDYSYNGWAKADYEPVNDGQLKLTPII